MSRGIHDNLRIGFLTDIHYAETAANEKRDTRAALSRLRDAFDVFAWEQIDLVICLGDLIHSGPDPATELAYLQAVASEFRRLKCPVYHCLGNHCVDALSKHEALAALGQSDARFVNTSKDVRMIGMDTCFNADDSPYGRGKSDWRYARLPASHLTWLDATLSADVRPTIVCTHHRLDAADDWSLRNAHDVLAVLDKHPHVRLVMQGHAHVMDRTQYGTRTHITLMPMISPDASHNACAVLETPRGWRGPGVLRGHFKQPDVVDI